jgi:hypothetical protein
MKKKTLFTLSLLISAIKCLTWRHVDSKYSKNIIRRYFTIDTIFF